MKKLLLHCSLYSLSFALVWLFAIHKEDTLAQSSPVRSTTVQSQPINLDFEQGEVGQVPTGWSSPTKPNYAGELTEEKTKSGKRAALLRSLPNATADGPPFGNLMQAFDATAIRGHRVRFRAAVRIEGTESATRAQLWMRVDRSENRIGFFDNMGDRPIRLGEWQYYEIVGDVEEDAATVNIGMILLGSGKAWLDDVSFADLGKTIVLSEPARPLTKQGLENLEAFTRLLGYVRHFHPSDEAAAADWDSFAIEGIRVAEGATNAPDLAKRLEEIFRPVAPTVRVFPTNARPRLPDETKAPQGIPSLEIVSWRHQGFGQKAAQQFSPYKSERVSKDAPRGKIPVGSPDPLKPFMTSLGGGVSCLVPLALFADAKGKLP
ncbi:MAG: hypothetical protein DMF75_22360, partial [Acidobacteria bacterium]